MERVSTGAGLEVLWTRLWAFPGSSQPYLFLDLASSWNGPATMCPVPVAAQLLWARANPWHGPLSTCSTWPHRGAAFFQRGQVTSREAAALPQVNCSWPRAALWPFPSHPCAREAASFSDRAVVSAEPPLPLPLTLPPSLTSLFPNSAFPEVSTPPPIKLLTLPQTLFSVASRLRQMELWFKGKFWPRLSAPRLRL